MGFLGEGHSGIDLALQVRQVRPGLLETAEEWVDRARQARTAVVDLSTESRARCYATAAGLSDHPTNRIWTETLVQLTAMWAIDDIVTEDQADIFAVLVRDGTRLDQAADLARLLTGHDQEDEDTGPTAREP